MINEIIYWELYALVVSFFNGVLLAWIYDNIRAFRRIVRHKTVAVSYTHLTLPTTSRV